MSFTQENRININVCHGCDKCCVLGSVFDMNDGTGWVRYYPTIGGKRITEYIDGTGNTIKIKLACPKADRHASYYITEAINKAHEISKLCDHYKTR